MWILIMVMSTFDGSSMQSTTFADQESCIRARDIVLSGIQPYRGGWTKAICVPYQKEDN
jgi:hypothetical protein